MRRLATALCILIAPALAAQRPITHEDVWLMQRLGSPELSPDGRWAVVSVTRPSYEPEESSSDLWIVATDSSGEPRRLTAVDGNESGVAWSPDGGRLAFVAKRNDDEKSQIYLLDMTGPGEAIRFTDLSSGASNPKWSPDGRRIAFESHVFPGVQNDAEQKAEQERRDELDYDVSLYDAFPSRHWDRWRDDRQVHLFVQDLDAAEQAPEEAPEEDDSAEEAEPRQAARDLLAGTDLVAASGYSGSLTLSSEELDTVWAPDGESLILVAATERDRAARQMVAYDLYRVPVEGGEPQRLTPADGGYGSPTFSPDGKSLYAVHSPFGDFVYNLTRLVRFDWPEVASKTIVAPGFDRPVGGFELAAGEDRIFLTATDEGRVRGFVTGRSAETARPLDATSGGVLSALRVASGAGGPVLVATWEDGTHPEELVRVDPGDGTLTPLTRFNADRVAELDWRPLREMVFTAANGRRIQSWLVLPPGFDENAQYPLVLAIHGGPHSSWLDAGHVRWHPQLMAAPGYVVLMTNYTGSTGFGEDFARAIQGDPLRTPGNELLEAADEAIRRFRFIDGERQAAMGASYGGHLTNWLQATTTRFRCLIAHAGLISLEGQWSTSDAIYHREINNGGPPWGDSTIWRQQSPSTYAADFRTPELLTIGEKDYRVPLNQTLAAWAYLQRNHVPSRLIVFHDANHWIMQGGDARFFWQEVHAWLDRYLQPGAS